MRRISVLMTLTALIAASCSSGDGGTTDDTTDDTGDGTGASTTEGPAGDDAAGSDGADPGDGDEPASDAAAGGPITIWVPSSLGLSTFVEVAFEEAPFDVDVLETPATYDETEDAARAALDQGQLAFVPATIGATLVDEQAAIFIGRIFEDDDPDAAARQLGVWLIGTTAAEGVTFEGAAARTQGEVFTQTALRSIDGPPPPPEAQEVLDFIDAEAIAYGESLEQGAAFKTGGALVEGGATVVDEALKTFTRKAGGSVVARTVAKVAGPVAAVLDFLKTMHDFTVAATEAIEAESNAEIALYDTGLTATGMISDATVKMNELRTAVIAGEISAAEAQELVSTFQRAISRASNVATDSALDLEEAGNEIGAAQIQQLRDRQLDRFFDAAGRTIDEIDSRPDDDQIVVGQGPDRIIHVRGPSGEQLLGEAAKILFGTPEGNQSTHSNGEFVVESDGETDLIGVGQFLWSAGPGGPGLDGLLPCGIGGDKRTLCGGRDTIGDYLVALAQLDGTIDYDSDRIYQYAFVFDRDSDPADNYVAGGSYPSDTWDQSDIRYEVAIGGGNAELYVSEGPGFAPVDSGARVHIEDNIIMGLIPRDEIGGGPTDPLVPMRVTTFWHMGDFGEGPDRAFNIDLFPVVGEPYWTPDSIISTTGPPAEFGGPQPIEPGQLQMFEQHRRDIGSAFAGFTPSAVMPEDPGAFAGIDECFANEYFFDNATTLVTERERYEVDGTSIEVRYEAHDSESAAYGAFGFSSGTVSMTCRGALLDSLGVELLDVQRTVDDGSLAVDAYELGDGADGLYLNVYSAYMDSTFVRVNTTGPPSADLEDLIVDALTP